MENAHRLLSIAALTALTTVSSPGVAAVEADSSAASAPSPAQRRALFGDLHLHTAMSLDAYKIFGSTLMPDDAYLFAKGEPVAFLGQTVRRKWPLDFIAITDHAENMGVPQTLEDPQSDLAKSEAGQSIRKSKSYFEATRILKTLSKLSPEAGHSPRRSMKSAWAHQIAAANRHYQPGKFTTFIGYEWTVSPNIQNLHRNVIFKGNDAPLPFSALDSMRPEDLWSYLERHRAAGVEALAIPHNANASNGLMYDWVDSDGKVIDQAYAQRRILNEPLSEIAQAKGQSETHPLLSPNDEFASFELFDHLLLGTRESAPSKPGGSYVRDAYGRGLDIESKVGVNPYRFGIVGATDFHNGLSTSSEDSYDGNSGGADPAQPAVRQEAQDEVGVETLDTGSGALTGVWAEENTRESIYAALRRKETFATSGSRLQLRFFGGWDFNAASLQSNDWVSAAYARGVSMGGDLPARPRTASAPRFLAWALKDPNGANLDRLQIIKVWLADGQHKDQHSGKHREKVFDVAYASNSASGHRSPGNDGGLPPIGNTVDVRTATYSNAIGAAQLSAVWIDPEFDPATPAVYYLRVIEIPTPRWSTLRAVREKTPLPANAPTTIQERGWSSPIWFAPDKTSRRR